MGSVKPSYNTNRILLGDQLPLDTPLSVILDVSERCNFKCNYCFRAGEKGESWSYAASNELMSMEVFKSAVEQLMDFPKKIKLISLSGHGEPLCNPHLVEMVKFLREVDVAERIDMHTNASLLTRETAVEIATAGFSRIVVSLQGLSADVYNQVCEVNISWERFYENLKLLYENKDEKLEVHIKITDAALDQNDYEISEKNFYSLFSNIADYIFIEKVVPLWKNVDFEMNHTKNKFGYSCNEVKYCPLVFYKIMVTPDGGIYPCTSLPPPLFLGNIADLTLCDAWRGQPRREFLKTHLKQTRHGHEPCIGCFVPVNSVMSSEDVLDTYKDAILSRLERE